MTLGNSPGPKAYRKSILYRPVAGTTTLLNVSAAVSEYAMSTTVPPGASAPPCELSHCGNQSGQPVHIPAVALNQSNPLPSPSLPWNTHPPPCDTPASVPLPGDARGGVGLATSTDCGETVPPVTAATV